MSSLFNPGDIVHPESVVYVYELLDDYDLVFYVGISKDPTVRLREHLTRAQNKKIAEIMATTLVPRMRIVAVHPTRKAAEAEELARIRSTPGILNVAGFEPDPAIKKAANRRKNRKREDRRKAARLRARNNQAIA